jgi:glutaredoxin-dependent peroxiredoxin
MALSVGTKAPDFSLPSKNKDGIQVVQLSSYQGKKNALILFFPGAFTTVCTSEMCSVSEEDARYEALGAVVLGISGDSPFALEAWAQKEGITILLLSDFDHAVTKAYDVVYDNFPPGTNLLPASVSKRSAFIVDKRGMIQYAESSDNPKQLPDFAAIAAKLKQIA